MATLDERKELGIAKAGVGITLRDKNLASEGIDEYLHAAFLENGT